MVRKLKPEEVEFTVECHPEDVSIRGNCSAIDPVTDMLTENWIVNQLESGNEWAWCIIRVVARWEGFQGSDTLGACSYMDKEDFLTPGGYYDDMKTVALTELNLNIAAVANILDKLDY